MVVGTNSFGKPRIMDIAILIATILFLAYSNGANDNMKGVATLLGSRTVSYRRAIIIATTFTFLGSVTAMFLAGKLLHSFSGKGLVPEDIATMPTFIGAIGIAAACTVFLATKLGFPISTTHSLTGALVGGGLMAPGVDYSVLWNRFFLPLLVSPFIAVLLTTLMYLFFRWLRRRLGVTRETCVCIEEQVHVVAAETAGGSAMQMESTASSALVVDSEKNCFQRYNGTVAGMRAESVLNGCHYVTAIAVSFARGLNDTPKIAALLLAAPALSVSKEACLIMIGVGIALGGIISARKVAITMSEGITEMNHGQGFSANLITAFLVIFASTLGMPVSTTHVSCGALLGVGIVNKKAHWSTIRGILLSWIITLPTAGLLAMLICYLIK